MDNVAAYIARFEAMGLTGDPATALEVTELEKQLGLTFPTAYKAFLLLLGRDGGPDFKGSDCTIRHLPALRKGAEELLRTSDSPFELPEKAVVFLMHQGYFFAYFVADLASADPPVFGYREYEPAPVRQAESFSAWLAL